jgi:hypothetical protein
MTGRLGVLTAFSLFILLPPSLLSAAGITVKGRLVDKDTGAAVPYATVVVYETDAMINADEKGLFVLDIPGPGTYSLGVFAEGYDEYKGSLVFPQQGELLITLSKPIFSMNIDVTEQRQKTEPTETIKREEIEKTPTGGDAFEAIHRESDIVKTEAGTLDRDYGSSRLALASALGFSNFAFITPFSYRSLPDYSNAYFLEDYIPLPFINYPSISNAFSSSIFPESIVESINLYGGGIEPSLGPGAGLIVSAEVAKQYSGKVDWSWQASLLSADVKAVIPILGFSTLEASLRKSYYEITWLPLLFLLDMQFGWRIFYDPFGYALKTDIMPGSGDLFLRYSGRIDDHNEFSLDVVTCLSYTRFVIDRVSLYGDGGDHFTANSDYFYLVNAAGASWVWKPSQDLENTLQIFDSLYTSTDDSGSGYFSGEYYDEKSSYPYNIAGGKETVSFSFSKTLGARLGAEFRHIYGSFHHQVDVSEYSFQSFEAKDSRGQALSEYEASLWSAVDWDIPPFQFKPSVRLDWFSKATGSELDISDIKPSPLLTSIWYPNEDSELELSVGQRYDRFDYFNWILFTAAQGKDLQNFWISGNKTVIDEKYLMKAPARLSAAQATFRFERPALRLGALGYGYYMDGMSGFDYQSFKMSEQSIVFTDASMAGGQSQPTASDTGFKDADRMYSTGFTGKATFTWDPIELSLNYTLGYSQIHLKETDEWMTPNSDITNYLKVFFHFPIGKNWFWDINTNIACGIPATPSKLMYYEPGTGSSQEVENWEGVSLLYNTMRDWMPRVTINFQTEYRWDNGLTLFLDITNLLSMIHYDGPDHAKVNVGEVEQSWLDRKYKLFSLYMDYLLNIKIDFGLKYINK